MFNKFYNGDCLQVMRDMPDNSVDSIVTDPPYGLSIPPDPVEVLSHWLNDKDYIHGSKGFMGAEWDSFVPGPVVWKEALRVLKPGGHLLAFSGTRTVDLMSIAIRLAGFEIRDHIAWHYGSGFPKSHDITKSLDKRAGVERTKVRTPARSVTSGTMSGKNETRPWIEESIRKGYHEHDSKIPISEIAKKYKGWGTALKPAMEPITVARKPISEKSVAANVERWGTGGINIDACRVGDEQRFNSPAGNKPGGNSLNMSVQGMPKDAEGSIVEGRFPANVIHDGTEFDESYSKFFYCAKPSKAERDAGLTGPEVTKHTFQTGNGESGRPSKMSEGRSTAYKNTHPTVKPTALMEYLCKLVTPLGGLILDPFMGSGSTGRGAVLGGYRFIGIDLSAEYVSIAKQRVNAAINERLKK